MKNTQKETLTIAEINKPITIIRSARAKKLRIRIDGINAVPVLTLPKKTALKKGEIFARENADWINQKLTKTLPSIAIMDGSEIPFFGKTVKIVSTPSAKRGVWLSEEKIYVSGIQETLEKRVLRFVREQAKQVFNERALIFAAMKNQKITKLSVKDTKSRWGSCSRSGNINLCWRLAFAPTFVSDYVIAHEVAHLVVKNHSKSFWQEVESMGVNIKLANLWLKENGNNLFCYGNHNNS